MNSRKIPCDRLAGIHSESSSGGNSALAIGTADWYTA
jgi:hypothetical protein